VRALAQVVEQREQDVAALEVRVDQLKVLLVRARVGVRARARVGVRARVGARARASR